MHILLTDMLTCPRCGPDHGLILRADAMVNRRVERGRLGCANCRETYAVLGGAVELGGRAVPPAASADGEARLRLAALLGVTHGPGFVLLAGPATEHAHGLAALLEDVEVVVAAFGIAPEPQPGTRQDAVDRARSAAVDAATLPAGSESVNRLGLASGADRLPLASGRLLAVALTGAAAGVLLEEGVRVLSPVGRLVLEPAPADAWERLSRQGLQVLAQDGDTVVASRVHGAGRPG